MSRCAFALAAVLAAGCATPTEPVAAPASGSAAAPTTAADALDAYYATLADLPLPRAPAGASPPAADATLTRILVGSCNTEEAESPALAQIAREEADLFLMIGDNVYGDRDGPWYESNDPLLSELRRSYADFAARPEFQAVRAAHPMLATWDDHDYGANDSGGDFPFKRFAERIFETFWGYKTDPLASRPGVYHARTFGPPGRRVQVIMLDTRFFRSPLTRSTAYGEPGTERYVPSADPDQAMLGEAQWAWLEDELRKPAELRLIVSSIQVLPDAHGFEAWRTLPLEQARLYDVIAETGAKGVLFISGDRHTGFVYRREGVLPYPAVELTSSSLNLSFRDESEEMDAHQIGAGYAPENFGEIAIDWSLGTVDLNLLNLEGQPVRGAVVQFSEIGLD